MLCATVLSLLRIRLKDILLSFVNYGNNLIVIIKPNLRFMERTNKIARGAIASLKSLYSPQQFLSANLKEMSDFIYILLWRCGVCNFFALNRCLNSCFIYI